MEVLFSLSNVSVYGLGCVVSEEIRFVVSVFRTKKAWSYILEFQHIHQECGWKGIVNCDILENTILLHAQRHTHTSTNIRRFDQHPLTHTIQS